jgi:hypothetical protein
LGQLTLQRWLPAALPSPSRSWAWSQPQWSQHQSSHRRWHQRHPLPQPQLHQTLSSHLRWGRLKRLRQQLNPLLLLKEIQDPLPERSHLRWMHQQRQSPQTHRYQIHLRERVQSPDLEQEW